MTSRVHFDSRAAHGFAQGQARTRGPFATEPSLGRVVLKVALATFLFVLVAL